MHRGAGTPAGSAEAVPHAVVLKRLIEPSGGEQCVDNVSKAQSAAVGGRTASAGSGGGGGGGGGLDEQVSILSL